MLSDYFPPTPAPSDHTDSAQLPMTPIAPEQPVTTDAHLPSSAPPSRVTLHLGHLPDKRDIKAPWPRTPSRVRLSPYVPGPPRLTLPTSRSTRITPLGPHFVAITNTPLPMPPWAFAFRPYWERQSTMLHALSMSSLPRIASSTSSSVLKEWTRSWPT